MYLIDEHLINNGGKGLLVFTFRSHIIVFYSVFIYFIGHRGLFIAHTVLLLSCAGSLIDVCTQHTILYNASAESVCGVVQSMFCQVVLL